MTTTGSGESNMLSTGGDEASTQATGTKRDKTESVARSLRRRHFIQSAKYPLLAFLAAVFALLLAYILCKIYPFGDKTLMQVDMYHQYVPFMSELISKMHGSFNLFYSWSGGLGTNFFATIAYYLASPFNLLLVFFQESGVTEAVLVFTLGKAGLAAAFFYLWYRAYTGEESVAGVGFSLMYALCGYFLCYAWNIMWLDGVYMMPLVMMGLERLVRGRSAVLFSLSVCFLLCFNFYISFFVILFTVLYYPLLLLRERELTSWKQAVMTTLRVGAYAAWGLALSMAFTLPTLLAIQRTSASGDTFPKTISTYDSFFDYFARLFVSAEPNALEGKPNLYAGVLILFLVPAYFLFSEKTDKGVPRAESTEANKAHDGTSESAPSSGREKVLRISSGLLLLLLVMSFNINILNFIWHGLHFPNQLPYRNSFVFVFFVITLSMDAFHNRKFPGGASIGRLLVILLGMVVLAQKLAAPALDWYSVYLTIGFLVAYAILLVMRRPSSHKRVWTIVFAGIMVLEMTINGILVVRKIEDTMHYSGRTGYADAGDTEALRKATEYVRARETGFYRLEMAPAKTVNDPYLYHYNGMSIFSSMSAETVAKMINRYGYHGNNINSYKHNNATLWMDSFFGIKYFVQRSGDDNQQLRPLLQSFENVRVYENSDALSLGFWVPPTIKSYSSLNRDPIDAQQQLASIVSGQEGVMYKPVPIQNMGAEKSKIKSDGEGGFTVEYPDKSKQAIVRLYMKADKTAPYILSYTVKPMQIGVGKLLIDGKTVSFDSNRSCVVDAGLVTAGTEVVIELWPNSRANGPHDFTMKAYSVDMDVYHKTISTLQSRQMIIEAFRDGYVKGSIVSPEYGTVLTTIPYDAGWDVKVDGREASKYAIDEGLIGFDVQAGTHSIEMRFTPKGLVPGVLITLFAAFLMLLTRILKWRWLIGKK